jgi:hypothetical protein
MHGPTCIFWANLTPLSLRQVRACGGAAAAAAAGLGRLQRLLGRLEDDRAAAAAALDGADSRGR